MKARDTRTTREQDVITLLGSDAPEDVLRRVLAGAGWDLGAWQLTALHHRPGAGATGVFSVEAAPGAVGRCGAGPQRRTAPGAVPTHACITSYPLPHTPDGVTVVHRRGADLSAWVHPGDPLLPGLPAALDPGAATPFAFGAGYDPAATLLELRSYRPLRRAVVLARNGDERRYLKVLRHGAAAPLAERHRTLRAAGVPAPALAAEPRQDVVAMHAAPGTPLAELLMRDGAEDVEPEALLRVLAALPAEVLSLPARPPWAARIRDYGEGAVAALPGRAGRIRRLAEDIDALVRSSDSGPRVPTHGDFYEGNLLIAGGSVSGLLDVDAVGPGHLVDDLACFLGHLAVLPALHDGYARVPQTLARFQQAFDRRVDPVALRSRAAAVSLTLVAGARRRPERRQGADGAAGAHSVSEAMSRLQVAEQFLADARRLRAGSV
ncbi:aminoglycoside phosphotransferase [Arthrobacter pityocampae]|uniref:Aminoglycoside phosphotransferase n=1 Tax=Arthrobacter pityocampae TaxID=547334 RepID=A0A2S5J2A5_9MICC|nr:aminoglycoside phosphotransferase [Arthrobacter pityocampae]PPB50925.1 aminoglycoside phosphotransferase [Arthrobacter pityocampae]